MFSPSKAGCVTQLSKEFQRRGYATNNALSLEVFVSSLLGTDVVELVTQPAGGSGRSWCPDIINGYIHNS